MTINYYVGWTGVPWNTALMPEPTAPGNYKDPEKIAAYVEERRTKLQEAAGGMPIYGKLDSVTVLDDQGDVVFSHTSGDTIDGVDDVSAGTAFVDFMLDTFIFPTEDSDYELRVGNHPVRLIGLEVKTSLKMAAMEYVSGGHDRKHDWLPTRMWHRRTFCVDPFDLLRHGVPDLTLESALSFLGSTPPPAQSLSHAKAAAGREIATCTGIALASATEAATEPAPF